jgi:hypothetical protein
MEVKALAEAVVLVTGELAQVGARAQEEPVE